MRNVKTAVATQKIGRKVSNKIHGTIIATPKGSKVPSSYVQVVKGTCSKGNKEEVVLALKDFFSNTPFIPATGFKDSHSTNITAFLNRRFPNLKWKKNASQSPFDCYSVEARIATEHKTKTVEVKKLGGYGCSKYVPGNASVYPKKAKVKDVVPENEHKNYTEEELDGFMDVIVTFADRDSTTNALVRYAIVDGTYWEIDYETYKGCTEFYGLINSDRVIKIIFAELRCVAPRNKFIKRLANSDLSKTKMDLRKLIQVENPTREIANGK